VHPTVRLDYLVRVSTFPLYFVLYTMHVWTRGLSWWLLVPFALQMFVWPHVAYLMALRSSDSKKAELRNLLIDSFLIGCVVPLTGFSLWPNAAGVLGVNAGNVSVGGPKFALRGMIACLMGIVTTGLFVGFHPNLRGSSLLTEALSIAVVVAFTTVFARFSYLRSQDVYRNNRQIRLQGTQIAEKSALLEQRSLELQMALDEAERANSAKGNFLASMSHELRTPLNSIIGFANILLRNRAGNLSAQDTTYLTRITTNGSHLLTLINGVLDLSKIDARQMQLDLTPVDVAELVRESLSEMEPQAEARDVHLVARIPHLAPLTTDRARLKQIILNLVGNAVKFTPHGRVTVRIKADPVTGLPARIDVEDTGVGIAADRLTAVFEAFQQGDTTTSRQYGGTGLGLTITRSLALLMGWEIVVKSEVGAGSTFSVIIKAGSVGELAPGEMNVTGAHPVTFHAPPSEARSGGFRVLVIDDEQDARTILQSQLEELGCEVFTAESADEGIALGTRVKPDLITLDIMMPRKNGWDALRELKGHELLRDIPVVIVSVVAREKRGRLFGAVDFIDKPVTREALIEVIRRNVSDAELPMVLLVHDEDVDIRLYQELAATDDMALESVTGVRAAIEALAFAVRAPELIVLDVSSWDGEVSGWVASLRDAPATARVRVVMVVSDSLIDTITGPLEGGATVLRRGDSLSEDLGGIVSELRARHRATAAALS
jgi:signal transduction histidine kinase/CheY-like chemotaxis protein